MSLVWRDGGRGCVTGGYLGDVGPTTALGIVLHIVLQVVESTCLAVPEIPAAQKGISYTHKIDYAFHK